jgi:hypothetical protein
MAAVRDALRQAKRALPAGSDTPPPRRSEDAAALGMMSTMGRSSGEVSPGPRSGKGLLFAGVGGVVVLGAVAAFLLMRHGGAGKDAKPVTGTTTPAPAPPRPAPVAAAAPDAAVPRAHFFVKLETGGGDAEAQGVMQAALAREVATLGPDYAVVDVPGAKVIEVAAILKELDADSSRDLTTCDLTVQLRTPGDPPSLYAMRTTAQHADAAAKSECLTGAIERRPTWLEHVKALATGEPAVVVASPEPAKPAARKPATAKATHKQPAIKDTPPPAAKCDELACMVNPKMPCCMKFHR